jgi:phosphoribosylformylglycinamidine synthase
MEIWCNESQERYVLAVTEENFALFTAIAKRERCPFAAVGVATEEKRLVLVDSLLGNRPIDLPMSTLFGKPPKMHRIAETVKPFRLPFALPESESINSVVNRLLLLPTVASKSFLITIADRTVTGLVARDQFVGPWQTPVADVSVILSAYEDTEFTGQAMAMGERTPVALISPAASARLAVVESLTNLVAANVPDLKTVRLSANWMSAASHPGEGAGIYEAVKAVGLDLCPALGLTIPVGKDSMSMKMKWQENDKSVEVTAPLSLIITAFGQAADARLTLTPQFRRIEEVGESLVVFLDLANGHKRIGGSCLAQVYSQLGDSAPDVVDPELIKSFWAVLQRGRSVDNSLILSYHDRSDGGLMVSILESCFAGHVGANIDISSYAGSATMQEVTAALFNEELGAVVQICKSRIEEFKNLLTACGFPLANLHVVGQILPTTSQQITVQSHGQVVFSGERHVLQRTWSETSFRMQSLRDNPVCAQQEFDFLLNVDDKGLHASLTFDGSLNPVAELLKVPTEHRPRVAILREQGMIHLMQA